jgi:hypothetical protein
MAEQQTLADLFYGGSDTEADDTIETWTMFPAEGRVIVERQLSPYLLST